MDVRRGAVASTAATVRENLDTETLDAVLVELAARADNWAITTPLERAELLARVVHETASVAEEWCAAGCAAKGYDPQSPEGGEELFSGVGTLVRMAQTLRTSMLDLERVGRPRYPGPVRHVVGGRLAVSVLPATLMDRLVYFGVSAEVWMEPGLSEADVREGQARAYHEPLAHAGVSLVLGAGNVASLGPRDVLHKLFAENKVVVLKANPVNDYLVPYWSRAMAPLIEAGYLAIIAGDAAVGSYLTNHELVTDVHVTGSDKTHDAIVFGVGAEGERRRVENDPLLTKPVSGELGNVSPVIIVPGTWSTKELEFQARHVATMMVNNAGFNCLTPRVIVTHAGWPQRGAFLDALERVLSSLPTRRPFYPGANERRATFLAAYPAAAQLGAPEEGTVAWTLIRDVDPSRHEDIAFNVEAFCALTCESALEAATSAEFVSRATDFCNDVLWGTLSATLIADPRALKDPITGPAIDRAVADLRYGSIGLNVWHALSFALGTTVWGAYPGHPLNDVQSGRGFVGNAYLFDRPQKSVVRGPFVAKPDPAWFATNANADTVMRRLLDLEVAPSWRKLPGLMWSALRG